MGSISEISLRGDLHVYSFGDKDRTELVAKHYDDLLERHQTEEILCLTRLCREQDLTDQIVDTLDIVAYPTVSTLTNFATETLRALNPGVEFLSDHERIELLAAFLSSHDWETDYLATAAQQESFQQDVGELLIEMESRDGLSPEAYASPVLREIAAVGDEFKSLLTSHEYIDEPSLVPRATDALKTAIGEDSDPASLSHWNVILIADFEEFAPTERRFLNVVSEAADASIVALAERQSRLLSSWRESGPTESMEDGLDVIPHRRESKSTSAPHTVGQYLVTGTRPETEMAGGSVQVIEASTFREQLTRVADEIERLCRASEYTYTDITVAYQDSKAPIEQTIRLLRRHGIPTTTIAVTQLGNDPAVRELYDVTRACSETVDEDAQAVCRDRLLDLEEANEDVLAEIRQTSSAANGLWYWLGATQLKDRIGSEWNDIEARDQFSRVQEVLELATFLDKEPQLDGGWDSFLTALERAFKYSSTRLENIETDRDEGGVPVGTIYGLKHSSYKAVFLLNVTDQDYPFTPDLTALLPTTRLRDEPQFPMLTTQSPDDVESTFGPATDTLDDPFHAYFTQVSRRLLGIGARTASDQLYFGVPREGADSMDTYHQPSRFLTDLVDTFESIEPLDADGETAITSHGGASEFVIEHVDDTLEAVRRASVGGDQVDLDIYERELAAIESVLDDPEAATVRNAIEARIDFRHGRVDRD